MLGQRGSEGGMEGPDILQPVEGERADNNRRVEKRSSETVTGTGGAQGREVQVGQTGVTTTNVQSEYN
jgi:hypothetical protein